MTRIDLANHRMVLSVKAWLGEQDAETQTAYIEKYSQKRATVTETDDSVVDASLVDVPDEDSE